jgi:hypothetical protein
MIGFTATLCLGRLVKTNTKNTALADAFFALGLTKGPVDSSPNATEAIALEMGERFNNFLRQ